MLDILVNNTDTMICTDIGNIEREAKIGKLGIFQCSVSANLYIRQPAHLNVLRFAINLAAKSK